MPFWQLVFIGLVLINLITFAAFGFDKHLARSNSRRVSESKLLWLVIVGGGIGAIAGQWHFRHKTKKQPFKRQLWTIIAIQTAMLLLAYLAQR